MESFAGRIISFINHNSHSDDKDDYIRQVNHTLNGKYRII